MKNATDVRNMLKEQYDAEIVDEMSLFDGPAFAEAIIGVTTTNVVVYDFDKMVQCLVDEDGMTAEEAAEFIEYNTVRTLPYMPNPPIIMYPVM